MSNLYRARRDVIADTLSRDFAEHLELVESAAGLHLAARARDASAERVAAIAKRAFDAGVAVQELAKFSVDRRARAGLVLGYGAIPIGRIEEGLRRLRACFP